MVKRPDPEKEKARAREAVSGADREIARIRENKEFNKGKLWVFDNFDVRRLSEPAAADPDGGASAPRSTRGKGSKPRRNYKKTGPTYLAAMYLLSRRGVELTFADMASAMPEVGEATLRDCLWKMKGKRWIDFDGKTAKWPAEGSVPAPFTDEK